jgi:hypothetical protein
MPGAQPHGLGTLSAPAPIPLPQPHDRDNAFLVLLRAALLDLRRERLESCYQACTLACQQDELRHEPPSPVYPDMPASAEVRPPLLSLAAPLLMDALGVAACSPNQSLSTKPAAFTPGVEGRGSEEVCQSTSPEFQQWTDLARKCEDNLRKRDAGDKSPQQPYCTQAEELRQRVTGVPLSSEPGAYNF